MPRLGEILVADGACSAVAVREALQNQVIFGGRLGTNLLELGAVTEEALARALSKRHGIPSMHGDLKLDPRALALVSREVADRCDAVPFLLAERRLAVLVTNPSDLGTLDEVAFASGKQVHPFVVPEARVWALLRRAYGIHRELRGIDVDWARLDLAEHRLQKAAPASRPASPSGGDLMDQSAFEAVYGAGGRPTPPPSAPAPVQPPPGEREPAAAATPLPQPEAEEVVDLTDLLEASPLEGDLPELSDAAFRALGRPLAPGPAAVLDTIARAPGHAPPARFVPPPPRREPVEPEPTPLGFEEALRSLEGVSDRGAIARIVMRYARSKFRRAILLTVNRGLAQGWVGFGEKLGPEAVPRVRIRLGAPGIVETVVSARAHYLGPIPKTEENVRLLKQLGGGVPQNAFLVPILALGRVVNVFYADGGRGGAVDSGDVGELLILATRIAQSYDTLLRRAA